MLNERRFCLPVRRTHGVIGLFVAAFALFGVMSAEAGTLDIIVESSTASSGTSGQFDIVLQNNSSTAVTIGAFSVDVLLSSTSDVSFTSIDNATSAPYIFSITGSFPPGFGTNLLPMEAAGFDLAATGGQVVNPGDTYGLADVKYAVNASAAPGTVVDVTIQPSPVFLPPPGGTSLSDANGNNVDFNPVNGTITVRGASTVPEPWSLTMLATSSAVVLLGTRLCRRRSCGIQS
jgi:hypothetical protein